MPRTSESTNMAGSAGVLSATARLHTAFTKPLYQRCQEITKIIDETSTKELHSVLPLLLENMFGFSNQMGWGLGRLTKNHQHDFAVMRHFLAPQGPLLNLIHKLLLDPYCRYEFPTACLPYPSRHTLDEGGMCGFYATKVQYHPGHGRPFNILSLNSFELYFFHFAYVLVNPNSQKMSAWSSPSDALYPVLLEDYFNYYLPLEGRKVPPMPHVAAPVRSPISQQSPLQRSQNTSRIFPGFGNNDTGRLLDVSERPPSSSTGAKVPFANSLGKVAVMIDLLSRPSTTPSRVPFSLLRTSLHQRTPLSPHQVAGQSTDPVEQETWRSQTLIEICAEFWLNQNTLENNKSASAFAQHISPYGGTGPGQGNLSKIDPYYYIMCESFLPSSDHVRVVRMFIKHLHLFTATVRVEVISSPYSTQIVAPLDELRRQVWPQLVQKKLYAFLRHGFERWPLDSSFRLMLETWLSFIQPWRYTNPAQQYQRERDPEKDRTVDDKWFPFIGDNLLFYTVLLQEFLPRVFRMDLSAPKNAYMLFRVSKVFNLSNLSSLLRDAESTLFEPVQRAPVSRTMDLGGSYLSPALSSRVASLNQQLTELEGPGFSYKPFFSDSTVKQIEQILLTVTQAKVTAQSAQNKTDSNGGSWWSWLFGSGVDYNTHSYSSYDYYDDLGVGDNKRLEAHLDQATANLCEIFEIPMPQDIQNMPWGPLNTSSTPESISPDHMDTEDGPALTPLGRYQMMNGLRHFDVQLRGDPETQRIRSYECTFLVRLLYQISVFLNDKYAQEIETLYHREDFLGRLASQYLTVPQNTRTPPRHGRAVSSPRSREARALMTRPRLSLRWLASYQNLAYVMVFYLATYFWLGLGGVGGMMLLIVVGLFYGIFMALFAPHSRTKKD